MIGDAVKMGLVVVAFAAWVTVHVAIVVGLVARKEWGKGTLAFVVPVFAPYFGARDRMWARAVAWLALVVLYVVARALAYA